MTSATRIEELKKRYEENPRRYFAPLANEYRKSGDLQQAIVLCQQHLTDQPANMNGHVVYGQALFESGRLEDARTTFETALTLDPENLIALRHLGDIARTLGDSAGARAWYVRVLDADPRNEEIAAFISEIDGGATASHEAEPLGAGPPGAEPLDGEHVSGESLSAEHIEAEPPLAESLSEAVTPKIETQRRITPAEPSAVSETQTLRVDGLSAGSSVPGSAPTPAVPQPAVPPPAGERPVAPPQRPSLDLMDLSIDLGAMAQEAPVRSLETDAQASHLSGDADNAHEFDEAFSDISLSGAFAHEPPSPLAPDVSSPPTDAGSLEFDEVDLSMPAIDAAPAEPLPPAQPVDPAEKAVESPASGFEVVSLGPEVHLPVPAVFPVPLVETPRPFVTETMAELYLQQGFREEAFAVYRQLVSENPLDGDLLERVHALESKPYASAPEEEHAPDEAMGFASESSAAAADVPAVPAASTTVSTPVSTPVPTPAPTPTAGVGEPLSPTVREFFSAIAARRVVRNESTPERSAGAAAEPLLSSDGTPGPAVTRGGTLDALFGSTAVAPEEEHLALAFARVGESVDPAMGVSGRPTQRAQDEVSLDRVFREAPQRARQGVARRSEKLRFDQFFTPATDAPAQEHALAPPPPAGDPGSPAELEQFQDWLEQLKKP